MSKTEWKECKLSELLTIKYGKNQKAVEDPNGRIPIYGTGGLMGFASRPLYDKPSILIGRKGSIEKVRYVDHPFWTVDTLFYSEIIKEIVLPKFLYYSMSLTNFSNYNEGTTIPSLRTETLNRLIYRIPSFKIQEKIVQILSSLDDKIELNNAINRNLEEQAQALFKSWFIDFEPFGGEMPRDWQTGKLSDIAEYEKDKIDVAKLNAETYYSTENMLPNKAGVSKAASLPTTEQTTRCIPGETIISNIRPYFKKIFYCTEEIAGCSADVLCFKPKKESFSIYNYGLLYSDNFFDYMVKGSKGTKMPRGDKSQIMNYDVVIPAESVISYFNNVVSNILQQISNNKKENECLAKLRDTLLPDLMSGELCLNT